MSNVSDDYDCCLLLQFAMFKRLYCDEFLHFCFQRFNVGVRTSIFRFNTERVVDFLMRENQHKLLFCWLSLFI
ncbi:putative FCP1 domain, HAD superfamily protein [Helianthus anomalus]